MRIGLQITLHKYIHRTLYQGAVGPSVRFDVPVHVHFGVFRWPGTGKNQLLFNAEIVANHVHGISMA